MAAATSYRFFFLPVFVCCASASLHGAAIVRDWSASAHRDYKGVESVKQIERERPRPHTNAFWCAPM